MFVETPSENLQINKKHCCGTLPEKIWRNILLNDTNDFRWDIYSHISNEDNIWELFNLPNEIPLLVFQGTKPERREFLFHTEKDTIILCCTFGCKVRFSSQLNESTFFVPADNVSILFESSSKAQISFDASYDTIMLLAQLPSEMVRGLFDEAQLDYYLRHLRARKELPETNNSIFNGLCVSIDKYQLSAIQSICFANYSRQLRKFFIQTKLNELLISTLQKIVRPVEEREQKPKGSNIRAITKKAEDILKKSYKSPPSLDQLAREIGTNRNKLSGCFKAVHGKTVFEYCQQYRMNIAKRLLQRRDVSVAYVAEQVGYDHAGNFTAAYKRYFGELPKTAKYQFG